MGHVRMTTKTVFLKISCSLKLLHTNDFPRRSLFEIPLVCGPVYNWRNRKVRNPSTYFFIYSPKNHHIWQCLQFAQLLFEQIARIFQRHVILGWSISLEKPQRYSMCHFSFSLYWLTRIRAITNIYVIRTRMNIYIYARVYKWYMFNIDIFYVL